ncbi:Cytochrome c oxidase subunit 2 [Candidatus Calditenuaceae archaeon HR02]|nr:Cytochrome c oxidase subunit 2 [Candidatus Calditenuaceae archaeon HR02]
MLGTGFGAILLLLYLTSPFLIIFTLLMLLAFRRGRGVVSVGLGERKARAIEVAWLIGVGLAWTVINLVSIPWLPWLQPLAATTGQSPSEPAQVVNVEAFMWGYTLDTYEVRTGAVKFVSTSRDTIHSLTIYSPRGEVLATVMLMPGMKEELVLNLWEPGEYIIRCLEFCGDGHSAMLSKLRVMG